MPNPSGTAEHSHEFHRDFLVRLPLPLAQLYSRAYNAADGRTRHDACFYLFEALVKLASCPLIAAYLDAIALGSPRDETIDELLGNLALPSLGHWVGILRELSKHFDGRADSDTHPMGHIWGQLSCKRRDLTHMAALYRRIKNGPDGQLAGDRSCSILQLIDALVQYRNTVFGHGAGRAASFYEQEMGPLLFPAVNEVLREGVLDLFGRPGSRLVYLAEMRTVEDGKVKLELLDLVGLHGERAALRLNSREVAELVPNRVAVIWPGRAVPTLLDPLLVYRQNEYGGETLFFNRNRGGNQLEYLSYCTGQTDTDKRSGEAMSQMLGRKRKPRANAGGISTVLLESVDVDFWTSLRVLQRDEIRMSLLEGSQAGSSRQWVFRQGATIQIGRDKTSDVRLEFETVSRHHATVLHDGRQWKYLNIGSNGSYVEGNRLSEFAVQEGTVVQVARTGPRLKFELPRPKTG